MSDDIILEDNSGGEWYPVIKRTNIGEKFVGGIIKTEQRELMKKHPQIGVLEPVKKPNGKVSQQLVVYLLVKENTMLAGTGDQEHTPEPGSIVRALFDRGGFHQWIEAKNAYGGPTKVGLLVGMNTTHIVRFPPGDGPQQPCGEIRTAEELAAYLIDPSKRNENIGRRGEIGIKECDDPVFVEECKKAYRELQRQTDIVLDDPFPGAAPVGAPDLF